MPLTLATTKGAGFDLQIATVCKMITAVSFSICIYMYPYPSNTFRLDILMITLIMNGFWHETLIKHFLAPT